MTPEVELRLGELATEALEGAETPDLGELAEATFKTLPKQAVAELALRGWREYLHIRARAQRTTNNGNHNASPQWDAVGEAHRNGKLDVMRQLYWVDGTWKFLGDLTRKNVLDLAAFHVEKSEMHTRNAGRFEQLATVMKRRRAKVVADLTEQTVVEVLSA